MKKLEMAVHAWLTLNTENLSEYTKNDDIYFYEKNIGVFIHINKKDKICNIIDHFWDELSDFFVLPENEKKYFVSTWVFNLFNIENVKVTKCIWLNYPNWLP